MSVNDDLNTCEQFYASQNFFPPMMFIISSLVVFFSMWESVVTKGCSFKHSRPFKSVVCKTPSPPRCPELRSVLGNPLGNPLIPLLISSPHPLFFSQRYGQLYDLSRSESSKVRELAVTMATEGQPLDRIGELLRVAVGPLDLSVKAVLQDAVEKVVAALR